MGGNQTQISNSEKAYFKRRSLWGLTVTGLTVLLIVAMLVSLNIGSVQISPFETIRILASKIPFINSMLQQTYVSEINATVIIQIRLPRIISAVLVGAALAAAGTVFQGIFRNPMADPYIIGVSWGAAVGAALSIVLGLGLTMLGANATPIFAFIFALITIFAVYSISRVGSKIPVTMLLLSGIAFSIFLSAIVSFLSVIAGDRLHALTFWLLGGFSYSEWGDVKAAALFIFIGIIFVYLYARDLNIMQLGEDTAHHLGVDVEKVKKILLVFASLVTASAVSISGLIGFVGLIVPHLMRLIVGPDHRVLIPSALITGAIFLVACDAVARVVFLPNEIPVGIVTALSGGPFFIYLLRKKKDRYML